MGLARWVEGRYGPRPEVGGVAWALRGGWRAVWAPTGGAPYGKSREMCEKVGKSITMPPTTTGGNRDWVYFCETFALGALVSYVSESCTATRMFIPIQYKIHTML